MALLDVENISARYGLFQALRGISLTAEEGETLAIVGANGAGKTTLLRAICGALPASEGRILFDGEDIAGQPASQLVQRGIAMVPEGRRLFPSLTVEDNLIIGSYPKRKGVWTKDKVYELFPELVKRRMNRGLDLSGGEQQMVAIGRALMSNPRLILMDEISLGLAPIVVNQIYRSLPDISAAGTTVLLVEQDLNRALSVSDHVTCLLEGHVELAGVSREIDRQALIDAYFGASQ
ncbi:ABC transporter ATP-binding protein [Celeribacter sp. HF31]|uniref:ABC transporter ATP-binding protein n=1 Tax=Celeribacter sp. HF31 TaxID=2721558 RepID=UPI001431718B|nr:ABC transporter ATP-binding protein [Celeribacter sp. HF31]NIY81298.1 ABC transporter ATP-binding protein [Celeribacter sp. HF31]